MKYKNLGITDRTFYGITIKPGEVKEFPGFINASRCIRVDDNTPVTDNQPSQCTTCSEETKQEIKPVTKKKIIEDSKVNKPKTAEIKSNEIIPKLADDGKETGK